MKQKSKAEQLFEVKFLFATSLAGVGLGSVLSIVVSFCLQSLNINQFVQNLQFSFFTSNLTLTLTATGALIFASYGLYLINVKGN